MDNDPIVTGNLNFNLDTIEGEKKLRLMLASNDLAAVIHHIIDTIRTDLKYNEKLSIEEVKLLEKLQDEIHSSLNDYNINLDSLIN